MKANRQRLLTTISVVVDCWDRAKTHKDFTDQVGAHIEDLRDILFQVPDDVIATALQSPLYRTTTHHEAVRFKLHGVTWLFRELAHHDVYAGEIVRTQTGQYRVHLFRVGRPEQPAKYKAIEVIEQSRRAA